MMTVPTASRSFLGSASTMPGRHECLKERGQASVPRPSVTSSPRLRLGNALRSSPRQESNLHHGHRHCRHGHFCRTTLPSSDASQLHHGGNKDWRAFGGTIQSPPVQLETRAFERFADWPQRGFPCWTRLPRRRQSYLSSFKEHVTTTQPTQSFNRH